MSSQQPKADIPGIAGKLSGTVRQLNKNRITDPSQLDFARRQDQERMQARNDRQELEYYRAVAARNAGGQAQQPTTGNSAPATASPTVDPMPNGFADSMGIGAPQPAPQGMSWADALRKSIAERDSGGYPPQMPPDMGQQQQYGGRRGGMFGRRRGRYY